MTKKLENIFNQTAPTNQDYSQEPSSSEEQPQYENHQQYYSVQDGRTSNDYDSLQQLKQSQLYQQEASPVTVGNHIQSSQQKAAAQKYVVDESDDNKGAFFFLLSYLSFSLYVG